MSNSIALSRALAAYNTWRDVERSLEGIERIYSLQLDREHIKSLWQDNQRVARSWALSY
jgi:hypothetical protein